MNTNSVQKYSLFYKLPFELIEYIWSFNYETAAILIQTKFRKEIIYKIKEIYKLYTFGVHKCNISIYIANFSLFYKNELLNKERLLQTFNACSCCERHKINKPNTLTHWIDEDDVSNVKLNNCQCSCRHLARWVCRSI